MQQALDFRGESAALAELVAPLSDNDFAQATLFKRWSINNILRHLHVWNIAASLSLTDEVAFAAFVKQMAAGIQGGRLPDFEETYLEGLSGRELCAAWTQQFEATAQQFFAADPKQRVKWVGPDMSAISSITARLMESWAHGQAVYDALGVERQDTDRIGNIVRLGINTFGWTYKNRRMPVPEVMPYVRLVAPSGTIWEYGEVSDCERIEGSATEFCQTVTQCRNIGDTALKVTGPTASEWMCMAQCFAGPPNDPPAVGMRRRA